MKRIHSSPRRVFSRLQLDALEDRLLLSVLATCPTSMVGDGNGAATQATVDSSSSPSDAAQAASTDSSSTTVCTQTGSTVNSSDAAALSVSTVSPDPVPNPVAVVLDPASGQAPSAGSLTPGVASPDLLILARAMDKVSLSGGQAPADHASAPAPAEVSPDSKYVAATSLLVHTDEHDLSWVDDPASKNGDQAAPPALLAQADQPGVERALPWTAFQLVTDFQPLDASSPFLVATLRSVAVQASKPDASPAVASLSASTDLPDRNEQIGIWDALVAPSEEPPMLSRAADAAADVVPETKGDNAVPNAEEADGYLFGDTFHEVVQVAIPVAGAVLALGFYQAQWPREEQRAAQGPRRMPVLFTD